MINYQYTLHYKKKTSRLHTQTTSTVYVIKKHHLRTTHKNYQYSLHYKKRPQDDSLIDEVSTLAHSARWPLAVVDVGFTVGAHDARNTRAVVAVDSIHTSAIVLAGIWLALINVGRAILVWK